MPGGKIVQPTTLAQVQPGLAAHNMSKGELSLNKAILSNVQFLLVRYMKLWVI